MFIPESGKGAVKENSRKGLSKNLMLNAGGRGSVARDGRRRSNKRKRNK